MIDLKEQYWNLPVLEERFNKSQLELRKIASTWMLVGFAAVATVLRTMRPDRAPNDASFGLSGSEMLVLVSILSCIGLLVLWIVDQLVYQRLIREVVAVALHMERSDPNLPPIRTMTYIASRFAGMSRLLELFYLVPAATFSVVAAFGIATALLPKLAQSPAPTLMMCALFLGTVGLLIWAFLKKRQDRTRRKEHYDGTDFARLIEATSLKETVVRYDERCRSRAPSGCN